MTALKFTCPPSASTNLPCTACRPDTRDVCINCVGTGYLDVRLDAILADAVDEAITLIRQGRSGFAEYRMVRAQLRVATELGNAAEARDLKELRFYKVGNEQPAVSA